VDGLAPSSAIRSADEDRTMITEPRTDARLWQAGSSMSAHLPVWLAPVFRRRTWAETLWAVLGLPIGIAGFIITITTLSVSAGLLVTFIGLPLLAVTGLASRRVGSGLRAWRTRSSAPTWHRRGR
jgi:hypothetical protein